MKSKLVLLTSVAAAIFASAAPIGGAEPDGGAEPQTIEAAVAQIAAESDSGQLVVDPNNPNDLIALEILEDSGEELVVLYDNDSDGEPEGLDGLTISSDETILAKVKQADQSLDQRASRNDKPSLESKCPSLPSIGRNNQVRSYLGCDQSTGKAALESIEMSTQLDGQWADRDPMAAAIKLTLESQLDHAVEAPTVTNRRGHYTIDLARGSLVGLSKHAGSEIDRALLLTVYSDRDARSVQFTIDGNCRQFAYATGGDLCTRVQMSEIQEVMG